MSKMIASMNNLSTSNVLVQNPNETWKDKQIPCISVSYYNGEIFIVFTY